MRVLLSEASSLTAREHLSVLGRAGIDVHVVSSTALPLGRFSRWCTKLIRVPAAAQDPIGYLAAVRQAFQDAAYDALLPTHEQAWLIAAGRHLLPADLPVAVAPIQSFDKVQGKIAFCALLHELEVPQPAFSVATTVDGVGAVGFPCWMKAAFSTAGRGVRYVRNWSEAAQAHAALIGSEKSVLVQQPATGTYAQVGALFDHGRLVAVHCSELTGIGAGGSAAARVGVDHPEARTHMARLGAHLQWHGGLTLDYFHNDGVPQFIECNPRTVEPGNAAASGVDLPGLTIALSRGEALPEAPVVGRPGVRTHSALALMLGAAERSGARGPAIRSLVAAIAGTGEFRDSTEVLTPLRDDPCSGIPLSVTALRLLARPDSVAEIAAAAVRSYAVTPEAVAAVGLAKARGSAPGPR